MPSRELKVVVTGDHKGLSRAFAAAAREGDTFAGRMGHVGGRVSHAFGLIAKAGIAGAGLGLGAMVKAGADFESAMARVQAVTGSTGAQMATLTDLAKKLGAETKFSAGDAADAMYQLSSAGFTVDEMSKAIGGTLSLAAASGIELADAAEISANALRGFRLDASKSVHVADVLAQAVNASSVEMTDLQASVKYIGPIAAATGQSFEQMIAALELMGNAGIKGEQAGTTLRGALVRLTKPTKQVEEGLHKLHLSQSDLTGPKGLKPLAEIIGLVEQHTKGMDKATRNAALAQIFGTEALSGMVAVVDQGSGKLEKLTKANERSDGAAKKAADTMNKTVAGAFENLKGSVETVGITLYERFQKPLREALLEGADLVNTAGKDVSAFFDDVVSSDKFKTGDLGDKISAVFDELDSRHAGDKLGDMFGDAVDFAAPRLANAAASAAPRVASAFGNAFLHAGVWGRLITVGFLMSKFGTPFKLAGIRAGEQMAGGVAVGAAAGKGKAPAGLLAFGKSLGANLAVAAGVAFLPSLVRKIQQDSATLTPKFKLPKNTHGLLDGIPLLGDAGRAGDAIGNLITGTGALKDFGDTAEATFKKLQRAGDSRGLMDLAASADDMARRFPKAADALHGFATAARDAATVAADADGAITNAFHGIDRRSGKSLASIRQAVANTTTLIDQRFGYNATKSAPSLQRAFAHAMSAIRKSMDDGTISVKDGSEAMRFYLQKLTDQKWSTKEIDNLVHHLDPLRGTPVNAGNEGNPGIDRTPSRPKAPRRTPSRPANEGTPPTASAASTHSRDGGSSAARSSSGATARTSGSGYPSMAWWRKWAAARGLHVTSGYRTPERNAAVGGVPNSWHTRGTANNPGAVDMVGPMPAMQAALADARTLGPAEALIHDAGSGLHLHVAGVGSGAASSAQGGSSGSSSSSATSADDARQGRHDAATRRGERMASTITRPFERRVLSRTRGGIRSDTRTLEGGASSYDHISRRFDRSHENLATPEGQFVAGAENRELARRKRAELVTLRRRRTRHKNLVSQYRRLIMRLKRQLKHAHGAERTPLKATIREYQGKLRDAIADARADGVEIDDATDALAGLDESYAELPESAYEATISHIDLQEQAGVITPAEAAAQRKAARDKALSGGFGTLTDDQRLGVQADAKNATEENTQGLSDLADAVKELKASMDANLAFAQSVGAVTADEALRFMTDSLNGQLGVLVGRRASTAGAGDLTRF